MTNHLRLVHKIAKRNNQNEDEEDQAPAKRAKDSMELVVSRMSNFTTDYNYRSEGNSTMQNISRSLCPKQTTLNETIQIEARSQKPLVDGVPAYEWCARMVIIVEVMIDHCLIIVFPGI